MRADEYLVLHYDELSEGVQGFFDRLETSAAFRELFLKDPAGTMSEVILGGQPSGADLNQANRLLFALLGNRGFMAWAADYQRGLADRMRQDGDDGGERLRLAAATVDRSQIYGDLVRAIVEHADLETMYSIVVRGEEMATLARPAPQPEVAVYTETFIAGYVVALFFLVVTQIDVSPEAPTEAISRIDLERVSGLVAERLTAQAQQLRADGALADLDRANAGSNTSWGGGQSGSPT